MKALSIRQPWCHAILHLGKRVENRDWAGCAHRGPVLLHASKSRHLGEFDDAVEAILSIAYRTNAIGPDKTEEQFVAGFAVLGQERRGEPLWRPAPSLSFGGIVGRARIVGTIPDGPERRSADSDAGRRACNEARTSPWYAGGGFALVLADVEPLPFIPYKGKLGFFDVPDNIVLEAQRRRGDCLCEGDLDVPGPHISTCRWADQKLAEQPC